VQAWRTQDFYNAKVPTCSNNNKEKEEVNDTYMKLEKWVGTW
jgi:hypothetical protein